MNTRQSILHQCYQRQSSNLFQLLCRDGKNKISQVSYSRASESQRHTTVAAAKIFLAGRYYRSGNPYDKFTDTGETTLCEKLSQRSTAKEKQNKGACAAVASIERGSWTLEPFRDFTPSLIRRSTDSAFLLYFLPRPCVDPTFLLCS